MLQIFFSFINNVINPVSSATLFEIVIEKIMRLTIERQSIFNSNSVAHIIICVCTVPGPWLSFDVISRDVTQSIICFELINSAQYFF